MIGFEGACGLPSLNLGCMRDAEALFALVGDFDQEGIAMRTLLRSRRRSRQALAQADLPSLPRCAVHHPRVNRPTSPIGPIGPIGPMHPSPSGAVARNKSNNLRGGLIGCGLED